MGCVGGERLGALDGQDAGAIERDGRNWAALVNLGHVHMLSGREGDADLR
mgnify:CR=1 FL=1